jgi:hypothetical protein
MCDGNPVRMSNDAQLRNPEKDTSDWVTGDEPMTARSAATCRPSRRRPSERCPTTQLKRRPLRPSTTCRRRPAAAEADSHTPAGTRFAVARISWRSDVNSEIVLVATEATGRALRPVASVFETMTTLSM